MSSGSLGKNSKTSDGHETKGEPDNPLLTTNGELEAQSNLMKRAEFSFGPFQHMDKLPPRNIANSSEVNSTAKKFADFTEDEEDLVFRMHRLVGNRWELIAGRIPGRTAEEIEMFWAKKHQEK